jgi:hypothetical protein
MFKARKAKSDDDSCCDAQMSIASIKLCTRLFLSTYLPIAKDRSERAWNLFVEYVLPYYTDAFGQVLWNLVLIFCGGQFALTIMAIQSFQQAGSTRINMALKELHSAYKDSLQKLHEHPEARLVFATKRISLYQIISTTLMSLLSDSPEERVKAAYIASICMKCIDPKKVSEALNGMVLGLVAIIATLRSNIARCISVGAMIGVRVCSLLRRYAEKPLYEKYPDNKDWVDVGLQTASSVVGFVVSLILVRVVTAFNSAAKGAEGLVRVLLDVCHSHGYLRNVRKEDGLVQSLVVAIIFVGVMVQVKHRFTWPWYLLLPLFPVVLVEKVLSVLSVL